MVLTEKHFILWILAWDIVNILQELLNRSILQYAVHRSILQSVHYGLQIRARLETVLKP